MRHRTSNFRPRSSASSSPATFSYDLASNRMRKVQTEYAAADIRYEYNERDQLTKEGPDADSDGIIDPATATTYAYDANGSTTLKSTGGQDTLYTWDLRNRLIAVDAPGTANDALYAYDSDGVRVAKRVDGQETSYLIDHQNPTGYAKAIEEYDDQGPVRSYVLGHDIIAQTDEGASSLFWFMRKTGNPFAGRVVKLSRVEAVTNTDYAAAVNARRIAEGQPADFIPEARAWGNRLAGGIVEHNGRLYVEVIVEKSECRYETTDGKPVSAARLRPYMYRQATLKPTIILRTYAVESIVAITIHGQRHELVDETAAAVAA